MVEDYIEDNLEALPVKFTHKLLELKHRVGRIAVRDRIAAVWRKKPHCAVAPVVLESFSGFRIFADQFIRVERVYRQKFHCGDSELFKIVDFLYQTLECTGTCHVAGRVTGETAHVGFIDYAVHQRGAWMTVIAPVKAVIDNHTLGQVDNVGGS